MKRLLATITVAIMALSSMAFCYEKVKCTTKIIYEIFKGKFTEPFEVCYLLTSDYTLYKITSNDEVRINFSWRDIKKALKKNGHEISDIIIIIHNHLVGTSREFSLTDIQTWYEVKKMGFTGNYYLLYQGNKIIYELIEDKDERKP